MEFITLPDLNQRTLNRRVGNIMRGVDAALIDYVICVAQGDKLSWTLDGADQLISELESCRDRLADFLIKHDTGY